ncbi:MAG TPA: bifunctional transaldolase/phosoglucose isomerase [Alphaproteobacteria bacterium]|nr:bifunctional transaldolase/phosoglucose isomerase [Alphaproteobacteria bacterium]
MNPLKTLQDRGQSVWLDYVRRDLLEKGGLKRLIEEDGVVGVTSNPAIFEKAIGGSTEYDDAVKRLVATGDLDAADLFDRLAIDDIQEAADILRPAYDRTGGVDGYISLEVSPYLAMNTEASIAEARRLWKSVGRPNLMVKIPGTEPGVPAIRQLISEGLNINVTLLFSLDAYKAVADAYLSGLEARAAAGQPIANVASVASFFVSRIDSAIEKKIEKRKGEADYAALKPLDGAVAIANAKLAYVWYQELCESARWKALAAKGAKPQRLLWASTGTKNPAFSDVLYVEELIGADTVNTMPPATMDAFRDHGKVADKLTTDIEGARRILAETDRLGLDLDAVTASLVVDGVKLFADAADKLYAAVESKRETVLGSRLNPMTLSLGSHKEAVDAAVADWLAGGKGRRLWARDASLWTGADEAKWLAWLDIVAAQRAEVQALKDFQADIKAEGFTDVLLLGMGGSSLGPEVLAETFGKQAGFPTLHVLDSTDPAQIKAFEERVDLKRTLFIVSSKSGSTLEPNILKQYFFARAQEAVGADKAGSRFVAVTDPGSKMEAVAKADGFRHIFYGNAQIGGRYSVLSHFGTVPGAAMGLDIDAFLADTELMVHSCSGGVPADVNPGIKLGCALGVLGNAGRDKVTIIASPGIADYGAWAEQLIAESTGKIGKGLIPVDSEPLGAPAVYGADRVFAYLRLDKEPNAAQDAAMDALEKAGQPVVRISLSDRRYLGQEFFRWEVATATAGAILGINPFDQPDVEASKIKTRALTDAYEKDGSLPPESPFLEDAGIKFFADDANVAALKGATSLDAVVATHLARLGAGDYCALLAYIQRTPGHIETLTALRAKIRDAKKVATCVGFGPRFLHSTGQAYKGGPNSGVFLQITCDDAEDLAVPGQTYTFGTVKAAQARGDFGVLAERKRRALRVHLGADVDAGLKRLVAAVERALNG